jgi:pimeloyl-ACP methyl ester carboxylesterase
LRDPLSQLADRHQVVLPDFRGCGRSTRGLEGAQYTPDLVVEDLLNLMTELRIPRFALLGFSFGGLIAQRLAVAAPSRVSELVSASSSVLPFDETAFVGLPQRAQRLASERAV